MDIWILFAVLVGAAAVVYRRRLRDAAAAEPLGVDDDMIRRIEQDGRVEVDEPNDLERIREEEARFWEESAWDEPEEP